MFFDLMDVTHVNSHTVYMELGGDILLPEFQNCCSKSLIGTYSNCNRSLSTIGWASDRLMNHPWPEKSQCAWPSSGTSEWDVIIARMNTHISNLFCPIRHVACTCAWRKREIIFWIIVCSFPSTICSLLYTLKVLKVLKENLQGVSNNKELLIF